MMRIRNQRTFYKDLIEFSVYYTNYHMGFYVAFAKQTGGMPWKEKA